MNFTSPFRRPAQQKLRFTTAAEVREETGGIPVGVKLSAQHIEKDIDAALEIGVDYIILDGRGGGTGAAPLLFRDNISVPTMPAIARARRHLDASGRGDVTLFITGGLRTPDDFVKAVPYLEQALRLDPSYSRARATLAAVYWSAWIRDMPAAGLSTRASR